VPGKTLLQDGYQKDEWEKSIGGGGREVQPLEEKVSGGETQELEPYNDLFSAGKVRGEATKELPGPDRVRKVESAWKRDNRHEGFLRINCLYCLH